MRGSWGLLALVAIVDVRAVDVNGTFAQVVVHPHGETHVAEPRHALTRREEKKAVLAETEVEAENAEEVRLQEERMYARLEEAYLSRGMMKAVFLPGTGNSVETDVGENIFNKMFALCPVVEYIRNGNTHSVYVRTKALPEGGFNAHKIFTDTWSSANNKLNEDFKIYDSVTDAKANAGAWTYCNYDEPDVGYPRECGKTGEVKNQWFSMPGGKFSARGLTGGAGFNIWQIGNGDCPSHVGFKDQSLAILTDLETNVGKALQTVQDQAAEIEAEEQAAQKNTAEANTQLQTLTVEVDGVLDEVKQEVTKRHTQQMEDFAGIKTKVGEVQTQVRQNRQEAETRFANEKAGVDQVSNAVDLTDSDAQSVRDEVLQNRKQAAESATATESGRAQLDLSLQGAHDEIMGKMLEIKGDVGTLKVKVRANRRENSQHNQASNQEHARLRYTVEQAAGTLINEVKAAQARLAPIQHSDVPAMGTQAQAVAQEKQKVLADFGSKIVKMREEKGGAVNDLNLKLQAVNGELKQDQIDHRSIQSQLEKVREAADRTVRTINNEGTRIETRLLSAAEHEQQNTDQASRSEGSITGELQHLQHSFNADVDRINDTAVAMAEAVKDHRIQTASELQRAEDVQKTDLAKVQSINMELAEKGEAIKKALQNKSATAKPAASAPAAAMLEQQGSNSSQVAAVATDASHHAAGVNLTVSLQSRTGKEAVAGAHKRVESR